MLAQACRNFRLVGRAHRAFASEAEADIEGKLKAALQKVQEVKVMDTSGGCGTMFNLEITAEDFRWSPDGASCMHFSMRLPTRLSTQGL